MGALETIVRLVVTPWFTSTTRLRELVRSILRSSLNAPGPVIGTGSESIKGSAAPCGVSTFTERWLPHVPGWLAVKVTQGPPADLSVILAAFAVLCPVASVLLTLTA